MKNTIKMSLVAAIAVAGFSTTASAGNLEEMIKGVSVSGKMEVEYDFTSTKPDGGDKTTANHWDLDWDATAKIPVNDNITAVFGVQGDDGDSDTNEAPRSGAQTNEPIDITKTYFQYANGPVTAMVGKQGMAGAPWYHDERGNGVIALFNAGPVVLAAAHMTNVNGHLLPQTEDVSAVAAIMPNIADSGINASLWYANISNVGSSYTANVNAKIADMINIDVRHTSVSWDDEVEAMGNGDSSKTSLTKAVVSADIDMFNVRAGYGMTNDQDNAVYVGTDLATTANFEGIGGDNDAAVTFGLEQLNIADLNDADVFLLGAGMTMGAVSLNLDYINGDYKDMAGDKADFDETFLQVDYKMSKNFTIGSHYSMAELDKTDMDSAAISLEYKF